MKKWTTADVEVLNISETSLLGGRRGKANGGFNEGYGSPTETNGDSIVNEAINELVNEKS